jgi:putative tryptophan/tyrosine transport system substrate-binding protein
MRRRDFIAGLGSAAAWPAVARAQQGALPVVGFIDARSLDTSTRYLAAFRAGLGEIGYVEGQNVTIEYHWLEGQFDRVPALVTDLVRRRVALRSDFTGMALNASRTCRVSSSSTASLASFMAA